MEYEVQKAALVIDVSDNVAVALTDLTKGDQCSVRFPNRVECMTVLEDISFGHKFALRDISQNEVLKYCEEIGRMSVGIQKGGYIHHHNMYCERGMK
ncbi:UxaA family hydrolase [Bacillus pinisoli]|uniref:UxaA family hydrolase n=1 Tax=Bacillus pinisoli TaxID=2901866 RepID=UPI001FF18DF7|nr:UxaA family hydrolase [Bacillus pinisoli]